MEGLKEIFREYYDDFIHEYFQNKLLLIQQDSPTVFKDILQESDIEDYLENVELRFPEAKLVRNAETTDQRDYTYPNGVIRKNVFFEKFLEGSTIALSGLHKSISKLAKLVRSLETETGHPCQTNIYLTPPNSQGFKIHYDSHDVIILQIGGKKNWKIFDDPILKWPHHEQPFEAENHQSGKLIKDFDLKTGDTLYIPRGVWHSAEATDDYSLHVTIGIMGVTWGDLIQRYVKDQTMKNAALREYVPFDLMNGKPETLAKALFKKSKVALNNQFVEDFSTQYQASNLQQFQKPTVSNFIMHAREYQNIKIDTLLSRTCNLKYSINIDENDSDTLVIKVGGQEINLPEFTREIVEFILSSNGSFSVKDLPDTVDDDGKVNLCIPFVKKGVLRINKI
jgi:ribosomal protein L16 Arg81 hydroxylase